MGELTSVHDATLAGHELEESRLLRSPLDIGDQGGVQQGDEVTLAGLRVGMRLGRLSSEARSRAAAADFVLLFE